MMKKRSFGGFLCFLLMLCCAMMPACQSAGDSSKETLESDRSTESMSVDFTTNEETEVPTPETPPTPSEPKEFQLRVGSYNIKHGEAAGLDMTKIANNITSLELDVVGLQEVDQKTTRVNGLDTMKALSEATGYPYYCFFKAIDYKGGEYGLGILSKYPILNSERFLLKTPSNLERRVLGRAEIDVDGTSVQFFVTHLAHNSLPARTGQFEDIANRLKSYDDFILTGDFNTCNFDEFSVIENSATVNHSQYSVATFPKSSQPIDNIVYSVSAWRFEEPKTLEQSYSDHYLLYSVATYIKK